MLEIGIEINKLVLYSNIVTIFSQLLYKSYLQYVGYEYYSFLIFVQNHIILYLYCIYTGIYTKNLIAKKIHKTKSIDEWYSEKRIQESICLILLNINISIIYISDTLPHSLSFTTLLIFLVAILYSMFSLIEDEIVKLLQCKIKTPRKNI